MSRHKRKKFACDFETTTDPEDCRVWAFASCPLSDLEKIEIGNKKISLEFVKTIKDKEKEIQKKIPYFTYKIFLEEIIT